ncbi:thiopeptide-type bacteriocin biosynthesis protein [Nonomuraea polychroma]|uniref:Thiopeptide-type bacteriocin biosynthesis protein n=1 Tax=Nonomuraea polychroma TaxID=46176 RepID=A0A438MIL9_9ACTN|nr:lantibiotic dehydratase C-terminal domain-containing protein [Nonomuraea polychroma]RVX45513.1 thiopeptide-type bacteriocin biosynthesis protein [Nonomuraea polychroma]
MSGQWVSAHVFHYGDLDALVTEVVSPVVGALDAEEHFFLRYWEGGQHVRLRLKTADPDRARDLVRSAAAAHFAGHPSTPPFGQDVYRRFAAVVAREERREHFDERLRPGETVEFIAYEPEHAAYGDEACLAAVERHFTDSSTLALRVLRAGTPMDQRVAIGLAALTLTLAVAEPDLPAAATRFTETAGPTSAQGSRQEALLRQAANLWSSTPGGLLGTWRESVESLRAALEPLHAAGRCRPRDPGSPHAHLAMALPPARRTVPLILLRCAHLFHNRLGLGREAELRTTYLLASTLTELAASRR